MTRSMNARVLLVAAVASTALVLCIAAPAVASGPPSGSPGWDPHVDYVVDAANVSVQAGDLNGDGWPDLVSPALGLNEVTVLENQADGTFVMRTFAPTAGCGPVDAAIVDLAGGTVIAVACGDRVELYTTDVPALLIGAVSAGPIQASPLWSRAPMLLATTIGGVPAVAALSNAGLLTYVTWDGAAPVGNDVQLNPSAAVTPWSGMESMTYGGQSSLLVTALGPAAINYVLIVPDGDGNAVTELEFDSIAVITARAADFNADGLDDLLTQGYARSDIYVQQPDGTFVYGTLAYLVETQGSWPLLASGACYPDILFAAGGPYGVLSNPGTIVPFEPTGSTSLLDGPATSTAIADFNGDGRPDLATLTVNGNSPPYFIRVVMMSADTPVVVAQPISPAVAPGGVVTLSVGTDPDPASVQWQRAAPGTDDWVDVPGLTGSTVSFALTSADQGARYRAFALTEEGFGVLSCPATVTMTIPATGAGGSSASLGVGLGALLLGFLALGAAALWRRRLVG